MNDASLAQPCVSVIIPTYNRGSLIGETILSVLSQTFENYEILIIDDGSTDDTESVVRSFADHRIVYLSQQHSGLPSVARNTGISQSRGHYLAFLDSDDLWTQGKLELQVAFMDERQELGLSYTDLFQFRDDPNHCSPRTMMSRNIKINGRSFHRLYGNQVIPNTTTMIRRSVVPVVGMLNEDSRLKANEDYEYWLRISYHYPVGYIDKPLAKYRQHSGGISKAQVRHFQSKLFLIDLIDKQFPFVRTELASERQSWLSEVYYGLGRSLLRQDLVAEAKPCFQRAWRHKPVALVWWVAANMGRSCYQFLDGFKTRNSRRQIFDKRTSM